jgi:hypothetical protein
MIISDFTADISTLNFGTDKETQVVHERFTPRALQPLVNCAIFLRNTSRHLDLTHHSSSCT